MRTRPLSQAHMASWDRRSRKTRGRVRLIRQQARAASHGLGLQLPEALRQSGGGMMRKLALAVSTAILLPSCGGSPVTTTATTTTTLPPCTQSVLFQGSGSLPSRSLDSETFSVSTAERLDVVVDWTLASSQIG